MTRAPKGRITDVPRMLAMYAEGKSTRAIAEHFGVKSPAVTRKLNENGVKPDRGRADQHSARDAAATLAAKRRDHLAELVANGVTFAAAAQAMRISEARVFLIWKRIRQDLGWQAA